ncbi:MAG: glycosyltransferase [Nitrososphaeria archaeon]
MFVSVIVITKNNIKTIERCIQSLLNQNYPKEYLEIIFVDGHSSDGTSEVIELYSRKFPYVKLYYEDAGTMGWARNIGINGAKGDVIVFTDGDAFPEKEWLTKIVHIFEYDDSVAAVGGLDILTGANDTVSAIDSWRRLKKEFNVKAISKIKTVNFAMRRNAILACGGFDPLLNHRDETELLARFYFKNKRAKIVYDPDIIVYHQQGPSSVGKRIRKLFVKSSIGAPVLLRMHVLRVAISNISSSLGTSLCILLACVITPVLFLSLLHFLQNLSFLLSLFAALYFCVIFLYAINVKKATGRMIFKIPLYITLDIIARYFGTLYGLMRWLVNGLINKLKGIKSVAQRDRRSNVRHFKQNYGEKRNC